MLLLRPGDRVSHVEDIEEVVSGFERRRVFECGVDSIGLILLLYSWIQLLLTKSFIRWGLVQI